MEFENADLINGASRTGVVFSMTECEATPKPGAYTRSLVLRIMQIHLVLAPMHRHEGGRYVHRGNPVEWERG